MVDRIKHVRANGNNYDVLLKDGTWFEIKRPDLSDIGTTVHFQNELLSHGIQLVEIFEMMSILMAGVLQSLEK